MMIRLSLAVSLLAVAGLFHWLAKDRPDRLFLEPLAGRSSPSDRARAASFRRINAAVAAVCILAVMLVSHPLVTVAATLLSALVPAFALVVLVARSRKEAPLPPVPGKFLVPIGGRPSLGELISPVNQLVNGVMLAAAALGLLALLPALPEQLPVHWNAEGKVDRMGHPSELLWVLAMAVFISAMIMAFARSIARERWVLPEQDADRYAELQLEKRKLNVRMLERVMLTINASIVLLLFVLAVAALIGARDLPLIAAIMVGPASTVGMFLAIGSLITRLTDVNDELRKIAKTDVLGTRPGGWRWHGMIYYAPDDPSVFVTKRSGMGQTLNFGRPSAWILLAVILGIPMAALLSIPFMG